MAIHRNRFPVQICILFTCLSTFPSTAGAKDLFNLDGIFKQLDNSIKAAGQLTQPPAVSLHLDKTKVDSKAIDAFGELGVPNSIQIAKDSSIDDLIAAQCPDFPQLYRSYLQKTSPQFFDRRYKAGEEVVLPACPRFDEFGLRKVVVKNSNDWIYNQFLKDSAGLVWNAPQAQTKRTADYETVASALNPGLDFTGIPIGREIVLPSSKLWVQLDLNPNLAADTSRVSQKILAAFSDSVSSEPTISPISNATGLFLVGPMSLTPELLLQNCGKFEPTDEAVYLRKKISLLTLLTRNASRLRDKLTSVTIAIPDSGLYGHKSESLQTAYDFYSGINSETPLSAEVMAAGDPKSDGRLLAAHGTAVSSIARGGPELSAIIEGLGYDIKLRPFNLFKANMNATCTSNSGERIVCVKAEIQNGKLITSVSTTLHAIWNLSVGQVSNSTQDNMNDLLSLISRVESDELFVVAAGNSGRSLNDVIIFPAFYGGKTGENRNIITVAALKFDGGLANFSSFGSNVDIAAPGCEIPAIGNAPEIEKWTGTSFSAPAVTFVAAILRSYGGQQLKVQDIKHRILTSADYDQALVSKINMGRTLNVEKALAVFDDVISLGTSRKLVLGTYMDDLSSFDCEDNIKLNRSNAKQIVLKNINETGNAEITAFVEQGAQTGLVSAVCSSTSDRFKFKNSDTGIEEMVEWRNLNDITFSFLVSQVVP